MNLQTFQLLLFLIAMISGLNIRDIVEIPENIDITFYSNSSEHRFDEMRNNVVEFHDEKHFWLDLERISGYNGHLLTVINPQNVSSFYDILNEVSLRVNYPRMYRRWNNYYILTWPKIFVSCNEISQLFNNTHFLFAAHKLTLKNDVYILTRFANGKHLIWETYSIGRMLFQNVINDADASKSEIMSWNQLLSNKILRRSNFQGAVISAAAANDPVFFLETKFTDDLNRFESGSAVNRFWFLRDSLNFTNVDVLNAWTYEDENGTLMGSGVLVRDGKVDLGIAQTPMTFSMKTHVDFLQPTDERTLRIFFVQPEASQYRDIYWTTFEPTLWIMTTFVWVILIILVRAFTWLKSRFYSENFAMDEEFMTESFIWAIGTVTQRGWHILPSSLSIRIIHFVASLTGFLCFTAFTASFVSFLSIKLNPMKSIEDLMNASYNIYSNENSTPIMYALPILQAQPGFPEQVIMNESISIPRAMTSPSGVIIFAYVFYIEARQLNFSDQMLCDLFDSLPILKVLLRNGMVVRKGSPYREFFNHKIMLMKERGFNHRFKVTYRRETEASCLHYKIGHHKSLGIQDVKSASIILLMGSFLSLLFLTIELFMRLRIRCYLNSGV